MNRFARFVVVFMAASVLARFGARDVTAQDPAAPESVRRLALPDGRTAGLSAAFWRAALSDGGTMPRVERLLVVAADGKVLGTADGDAGHVLIPEALLIPLTTSPLHATIVHNHPGNGGLSGDDLAQLAKPGVDRVIALGHDGTVFEASKAGRFNPDTFAEWVYPHALAQVGSHLSKEAWAEGINLASVTPNLAHFVSVLLDRAGIINYQITASLEQRVQLNRNHAFAAVIVRSAERF